ncbi:MAG: sigma 54-interacting transcriptional regulator, partial [Deltaproteobacteria bacterium]|nr:sigma 54-interacting transcriptional regulator [Deltaproteobacteria bacterium]
SDLGSTNGTLVNNEPIAAHTPLEPYDTIKIGQELFIFEPGISVIAGPAPFALIIGNLEEPASGLTAAPAGRAAAEMTPEDVPALMALSHSLLQCASHAETETVLLKYLHDRFGITFMSVLWPAKPPVRRLVSLLTSHDDKRLILGQTPFDRVVKSREVLLWPSCISELTFQDRERHVLRLNHSALLGPLYAGQENVGLMYLENLNRQFTSRDLKTFAAMLILVSPAVAELAGARESRRLPGNSQHGNHILPTNDTKVKIVYSTARQAAAGEGPIMLHGEAGTGKSVLARYIHEVSPRKGGRLVSVNLSDLPQAEIETILFGLAQTPSSESRAGLVELADGGTLLLRHVEFLPPSAQKFLMMAMEEGIFFPAGAHRGKVVSLRIISSTSADLAALVDIGQFREDLYMRLNALVISLPPLREIKGDLESLLNSFLNKAARDLGVDFNGVDPAALECLRAYRWPGNITELRLEAGLMVLFNRNGRVTMEDLPAHLRLACDCFMGSEITVPPLIGEAERHQIMAGMSRFQGDLEQVASLLGRRPEYLIKKMRALRVDPINYQVLSAPSLPKEPSQTALRSD